MKKYITDVFNDLSSGTEKVFCRYTIRENMDELSRERIYQNVMSSINARQNANSPTVRHTPMLRKVSAAAAACLIVASVGAVGVGASKLYKGFADYNPSYTEAQKQEIEKASFVIGKQMKGGGAIVTATEAMCDGNKFFVLFNKEVDKANAKFSEDNIFYELHMTGDPDDTQGYSAIYHQVLEKNGNTSTELVVFDMGDVTDGQQLAISVAGAIPNSDEPDIKIGGIQFAVKKTSFAKAFDLAEGVKFKGYDVAAYSGYVSPWYSQFMLQASTKDAAIIKKAFEEETPDFKVVMKDGTVHQGIGVYVGTSAGGPASREDVAESAGSSEEDFHAFWDFHCAFGDYVETSEIDHVEINGTKLSLNDVKLEQAAVLVKPPVA